MRPSNTTPVLCAMAVTVFLVAMPASSYAQGEEGNEVVPRTSWSAGIGLGFGSSWLTAQDGVTEGGSLTFDLDVHLGKGLTDKTLLTGGITTRAAWFPDATSSEVHLACYTLTATHFPFERAGLFASLGGGFTAVESFTLRIEQRQGPQLVDGMNGYLLLGALGYEWRVGSSFAVDLQSRVERHQFDDAVDGIWTTVTGVTLRWYL